MQITARVVRFALGTKVFWAPRLVLSRSFLFFSSPTSTENLGQQSFGPCGFFLFIS